MLRSTDQACSTSILFRNPIINLFCKGLAGAFLEETFGASSPWSITSPYRPAGLLHPLPLNACVMLLALVFAAWVAFFEPAITIEAERSVSGDAGDAPQAARIAR